MKEDDGTTGAVYCFADEEAAARGLARELGWPCRMIDEHRFPDGEIKLRLPLDPPSTVAVYRSLARPNDKLVELMLVSRAARGGVARLMLVAPYLAYMRQDTAFAPGEIVSQRIVGAWLAELFDTVIAVDPHLHRVRTLREAVPAADAVALSAAPLLGRLVADRVPGALLLGPDEESAQWVAAAAAAAGLDHDVCRKARGGDRDVRVTLPPGRRFTGRAVVLLDDVASTGHTLATAARGCFERGAGSVDVAVSHALFAPGAEAALAAAGIGRIWSTDSIAHPSNAVPLAALLAAAVRAFDP